MRHAKSAWPVGVRDPDRPLNARGKRTAPLSGSWIMKRVGPCDRALVSTATRTQQTWQLASQAGGLTATETVSESRVYAASWWDLLDLIREQSSGVSRLLLLGHNPGMEDLSHELAGSGDRKAMRAMRAKFPTAAVAVLTSDRDWTQWGSNCAELTSFFVPRA